MLHSLAHLLITTAALECGYGALNQREDLQLSRAWARHLALHQWQRIGRDLEVCVLADRIDQLVALLRARPVLLKRSILFAART